MELLEVILPGPLTTVQDLGRYGYQQYGVPPSGAVDNYAFRVGNLLVGNEESLASLEITLFGGKLRFLCQTVIAVTGADLAPTLNGSPIPMWESVLVRRDDILSFPRLRTGCRAYLAVAGGISVPKVMGSASTLLRAGIGGFAGRALRKGDILDMLQATSTPLMARLPSEFVPLYGDQIELRVMLGPQDDYFTQADINTFLASEYTVTTEADRMGYRLEGPRVQHRAKADIISDGIPLGAVQIPGDGLPIILLADRPTTGGYTKIATVISVDIPKIAQAKPGDKVRFKPVSEEEALSLLGEYEQKILSLRRRLKYATS